MPTDRTIKASSRQWLLLLAGLLAVLVGVLVFRGGAQTKTPVTQSNPVDRRTVTGKRTGQVAPQDLNVRLEELAAAKEEPQESERNPFRFQERRPEPKPGGNAATGQPA